MKVALISQYYPPERGAVLYGQRLARGMASRRHRVTVLAGTPHFPKGVPYDGFRRWTIDVRTEDGAQVVRLPLVLGSNSQPFRRVLGFVAFAIVAACRLFLMPRQDVIIASVPPATTTLAASLICWVKRSRLVVLLRDIEPLRALEQRRQSRRLIGQTLIGLFMWLYRRAVRVVVVHHSEVGVLLKYGIQTDRIVVIPHGVDVRESSVSGPTESRVTLPRRERRILAAYVGTIGLVHGLDTLLETISSSQIRSMPVDFVIVGDGQFAQTCREIVTERGLSHVSVFPSVPLNHVDELLAQADVLICSFRNEDNVPLGSKFYEYCASGKPILVHGRNIAGSLVAEIGNGIACEAGDVHALEAALQDLVVNHDRWKKSGELGRIYAERHFAQEGRDRQWEGLLQSIGSTEPHSPKTLFLANRDWIAR